MIITIPQIVCLFFVGLINCYGNEFITNHVALLNKSIYFSLSGADLDNNFTLQDVQSNKEISTDRQLHWILENKGTNYENLMYLGMTNSFEFNLFDTNGNKIVKTARGKAMSMGPKSLVKPQDNDYVRVEGFKPGQVFVRDFPKLDELFIISSDGAYIIELRYWCWIPSEKKFILSNPVKVRALKKDDRVVPKP